MPNRLNIFLKKWGYLPFIGLIFFAGCQKQDQKPPIGKIVFDAEYVSILPKDLKQMEYWVILSKVDPILTIKEGRMTRTERLEDFEHKAKQNHYFSDSHHPQAFILGEFINGAGQIEEKSLLITLSSFQYDAYANAVDFDAKIEEEMSHWVAAKRIKLLNFELFFQN